jgi:tetratricopeptide (TPR) repeat protein
VLAKRKKITKKEMKEDKLVTYYYKAKELATEYQGKILIGLGVVAVIVVGVILMNQNSSKNNLKANSLLAKVYPLYEGGQFKDAIEGKKLENISGLKQITDEYGSTEAGEMAKLYLANSYYYIGEFDNALKYYKDFSGSGDIFKATSYAGMAACYETKKEYKDAAEYYKKAASVTKSNTNNAEYLLKAGINYIAAKQNSDAKELFLKIKEDYKTSMAAYEVDKYIAIVGGRD